MGRALWLCVCLAAGLVAASGRDTLFGHDSKDAPSTTRTSPQKDEGNPADVARPSGESAKAVTEESVPDEPGVRIRPLKLDEGIVCKDRLDFQISRIDKPLARETSALFREAWMAFRTQNQLRDSAAPAQGFARVPQTVVSLRAKLLQDLGDGRWLVDAEWVNLGLANWCPAGPSVDKAVLVLAPGEGKVGATVEVNAVHVGLVEARFDCEVPPAVGRRISVRRHAFLSTPALPDDEATRSLFQKVVTAGNPPVEAVMVQVRDCKTCGGLGYVRRAVPGKIQDAHDPCPDGCDRGHLRVPVLVTFKP